MRRAIADLRCERGQTATEYLGLILIVAAIIGGIVATGIGTQISHRIEDAICQLTGGDCGREEAARERCKTRSTTSTDKVVLGVDVRLFSGGGGGERVIIKEEFDDGTARYTITDKASLEAALGSKGGSAGVAGVGGSLTAALAAEGVLQNARIFETANAEQTSQIEAALQNSGGLEGVARGVENALDVPADFITSNIPFVGFKLSDHVDIDGFLFDQVFGDENLPEPNSEAIGGELAIKGNAGARDDRGPEEVEAGGELRAAAGGLQFTSGPREGEREFYYKISGKAGAELKSEVLGVGNAGASGELTVTLVLGADGLPKTLRVNGTGTATALNNLGDPSIGLSEADLREFAIDRDLTEGKTVEFTAELDLRDPDIADGALDILRSGSVGDAAESGLNLARLLGDKAKVEYGIYDTTSREDTTNTGIIVASLTTEDSEQVNVLEALYRKAPGGTFQRVDCST